VLRVIRNMLRLSLLNSFSDVETLLYTTAKQGCGVVRSRRFLGGVGFGFFCPTPEVQLDHFLHHTPKMGIPVEIVQLLWNFC